ncbi:permease [Sphingomonas sp. Leaf17]|uniref:cell division protein FtsX n=1 Tax=Sphingomonas sp. Leaf17 TaxID=1735683 RepID=UPI0006F8124D|nr:FtsX-like permease family protein [Sphingomonas sp. Leaf17]KQM62515.1 permease [Sphingomonas sp. Leaf17]
MSGVASGAVTGGGSTAERRVLDEASGVRAMTWVMAIMVFLTVLATALGLATLEARGMLDRQLAGRMTIQIVEGDTARRDAVAARVTARLKDLSDVARVRVVDDATLARLLEPWLGAEAGSAELPMPALIDVDLRTSDAAAAQRVAAAVRAVAPGVAADRHERWMSPVSGVMTTLAALAGGLVVLMAVATGAVVLLAVRAALEAHRATIEVMHMLGATDVQVARLFQRRLALDALVGGIGGGIVALVVTGLVGGQVAGLGSDLLGGVTMTGGDWVILALVPFGFVVLAMLTARRAVLTDLRRSL